MQEALTVLALILVYGAFHSLLAAFGVKTFFMNVLGQRAYLGLYRLFFNAVAVVTLLPIFGYMAVAPGDTIWSVDAPWSYGLLALQAAGLLGLTISLLQIDWQRFAGLREFAAWLSGDPLPLPPEELQTGGVYALMRHPLYLFSLLLIWPIPAMSAALLGFNIGATVYFVIGSLLEEQKLLRVFGQSYAEYRARVPWMIPFTRSRARPLEKALEASEGGTGL
jgi:protein-S-isoprenylcysteine O-methyltransferase Ste14